MATRGVCSRVVALSVTLLLSVTDAQLRPRRVGTNAMGDQEVVLTDVETGGGGGGGGAGLEQQMAAGMEALQAAMGGEGGLDMGALLKNMDLENNPMLKAMAEANPEMAKMLSDPEALKGQMEQVANLMSSPEGQGMAAKMMQEMQSVMTDPEKLKAGLEQLGSNPALKGLADAIPGLQDVLDDPAQLEEQAAKAAELFSSLSDPEKAKDLLAGLGGGEGGDAMENLQQMLAGLGGDGAGLEGLKAMMEGAGGEGGLGDLLGGAFDNLEDDVPASKDDLKARVREQMAAMMNNRRGGIDDDEF